MLLKLIFKRLSVKKQADIMIRQGIVLGTHKQNGRQAYVYMVNNLFAEILYENDNPGMRVESVVLLDGLNKLNSHLKKGLVNKANF